MGCLYECLPVDVEQKLKKQRRIMKEKNLLSRILQNISCPAGILGTDDFTGNKLLSHTFGLSWIHIIGTVVKRTELYNELIANVI